MKSYKNAAFTLIMLGLITAPAAILAMEAFDDVAMQQSLTNRNGNNNYNTDDDDAFLNSSEYLPSEFYGEDWNDIYLTPPPPTCTNLEDLGKDLDKLEDFESYDEFQKRLSNASLHAVTNDAHTNASPTATPPTTPKSSVTQYIPSQREVTLTAGVLATIAYGVQQAPAAVLRKIAIDTDITRNGSAGSLGAAFTQAFLNFVEAFGLPAVILGSFSAMYWEVRKIERCEVQNKEMTRKLNTQDEYIKRLSGGIKKHDIAFHQVVESEIALLHKIHKDTLPIAQGMKKTAKCTNCADTEKLIKEKVTLVIGKQLLDLDNIHSDSEKLLADKEHHKTIWQKVKKLFTIHAH